MPFRIDIYIEVLEYIEESKIVVMENWHQKANYGSFFEIFRGKTDWQEAGGAN